MVVPAKLTAASGLKNSARVRGTVEGAAYRSTVMLYNGVMYLGVHKATLAAAGVAVGDRVAVRMELDDEPRPADTVPQDLAEALDAHPAAKAVFERQAPSHRREHVKYVLEAKQAATRARRIAKTVETLAASAKPASKQPTRKQPGSKRTTRR